MKLIERSKPGHHWSIAAPHVKTSDNEWYANLPTHTRIYTGSVGRASEDLILRLAEMETSVDRRHEPFYGAVVARPRSGTGAPRAAVSSLD